MNLPAFGNPPRAIAIDLDGTLLNSQTLISGRNHRAVEACLEQGIPVIIATQRAARTVRRILGEELYNKCSLVLLGGALAIAAYPLSGYFREIISPTLVKNIIEDILVSQPNVRIIAETGGYQFGTNIPLDQDKLWIVHAATPDMQLPLDLALADGSVKVAIDGQDHDLSCVITVVSQRFGNSISVIPSDDNTFLNITNSEASKPKALKRLLNSKQISVDDIVAIGDDIPDLDMLATCGISVAMGNAVSEVKAITSYQTLSNDEDGVAVVLEKILAKP